MQSKATTVEAYLRELPADRRGAIEAVRRVINDNLPAGYREGMQYGMIGWFVPHEVYPKGYHCDPKQPLPFASLASQKNHMALYLCAAYMSPEDASWFREAWKAAGKKLDMGASCVRFRRLEDVPPEVVGEAIARWPVAKFLAVYEGAMAASAARTKAPVKKKAAKKVAKKAAKKASKKTGAKRAGVKKAGRQR